MRHLLQTDGADDPFFIATPRELESAILQGRRHIVVTAHLDMTALPLRDTTICDSCDSPLPEIRETMSIRGNCSRPPSAVDLAVLSSTPGAAALLPLNAGQCLIMSHDDLFPLQSYRMWYDNLYLRAVFHNTPLEQQNRQTHYIGLAGLAPLKWPLRGLGARYITRVTLQGDGLGPTMGVWADESAYLENCTFANLGGDGFDTDACDVCSSAVNAVNASVTIVNSTFFDPMPWNGSTYIRAWAGGQVLLSGCEFAEATDLRFSPFQAYDGATIFSDDTDIEVRSDGPPLDTLEPSPLLAIPTGPTAPNRVFLQRSDPWFANVRSLLEVEVPLRAAYPAPVGNTALLEFPETADLTTPAVSGPADIASASQDSSSSSDGLPAGAIAAIVAVVALLLLALVAAAFVVRCMQQRRRRVASKAPPSGGAPDTDAGTAPGTSASGQPTAIGGMDILPWDKGSIKSAPSAANSLNSVPSPFAAASMAGGPPAVCRSAHRTRAAALPVISAPTAVSSNAAGSTGAALPPHSIAEVQVAFLMSQLDAVVPNQIVLGMFRLLGASDRRRGGHSVVAFATGVHDHLGYAIKFFTARTRFDAETALYSSTALRPLAPKVEAIYDPDTSPDAFTDRFGRALPPCIVMERGESLNEWSHRAQPDIFQAVAVLAHVALRLRDMHGAGFVHRNVKPSNIMLLARENRWTVIDFGNAMLVGQEAPVSGSLAYTAPEAMRAAAAGAASTIADPAVDAWALGVVAFELLTGKQALDPLRDGHDAVRAQLRGETLLPWEGDNLRSDIRRKLGIFREPVLGLLRRDPEQRVSMQNFCDTCNDIVTSSTTMAGPQ